MDKISINQFLEATASDAPVPGGGSVSALCGAVGSALAAMVCRLTIGRKKYAQYNDQVQGILDTVVPYIESLKLAIEADSQAYHQVMSAFKLPKDTPEQQDARKKAIQDASKIAATVPYSVAKDSMKVMEIISPLIDWGNQNAVTDMGVAMMCLRTAVLGACLNVRINLQSIEDQDFVSQMDCSMMEQNAIGMCDQAYNLVLSKVSTPNA